MDRSDVGKAAIWRDRLRRFHASATTVSRFCQAEGVSVPTFYAWRKKLGSSGGARPVFKQVVVTPSVLVQPCLRVRLASGAEIEADAGNLELIRAVVGELARAECAFVAQENRTC